MVPVILHRTKLAGVMVVEGEPHLDERGSFMRTFDADVFVAHGLDARVAQCSTSFNARAGTLRGLHYQAMPHAESKLVRCTRGRIFDVVVDLRPRASTHRQWVSIELSADGAHSLFIPEGCAHGFQTLEDDSEVHYQISTPFVLSAYRGVRWDDPAFAIEWPEPPRDGRTISDRDLLFPDYAVS
jgi:dTDP-4-dehydrorhamnose 3,5-epimerase